MHILITGASGFVGPILARTIKNHFKDTRIWGTYFLHHEFHDIDEKVITPYHLDLQNLNSVKAALKEIKPDLIFHLAAQSSVAVSWKNPYVTFSVNILGSINLLEAVKDYKKDIPVLMIGSSEEYGKIGSEPISEKDNCEPANPYGLSKFTQEKLGKLYADSFDMNIRMTRSFNHIGPGQSDAFVISDWCKQAVLIEKGRIDPVLKVGNIKVERDFSHVEDVCQSYVNIMEKGSSGEIYNVGSGKSYTLEYILKKITELVDGEIKVEVDPDKLRPSENPVIKCDNSKLQKIEDRNYRPIENTLKEVMDYWRENV